MPIVRSILLFPVRFLVFLLGFVAFWMEKATDFVVGIVIKTEYVRLGSCIRCGKCCSLLALTLPKGIQPDSFLVRCFGLWHRLGMNFIYEGAFDDCLCYSCGYLRQSSKVGHSPSCGIYPFRHRICRFFPTQKLYGKPSLHEGCGFSFVKRSVYNEMIKLKKRTNLSFGETLSQAMEKGREGVADNA